MTAEKRTKKYAPDLAGKVVAVTGSTGGLGRVLCKRLAALNATILTLDRDPQKSRALRNKILSEFPDADIESIKLDLSDFENVKEVCGRLENIKIDFLFLNAGVYNVPLTKGDTGYNNVFQVNFVSQYYLVKSLLPAFRKHRTKVIAVGSIAHRYARLDVSDVDFSRRKKASKIYGNSKRFLMYSLWELYKSEQNAEFAVAHPGVTLTNMANHYPKAINWLVKIGVKLFFPSPEKASLSLVAATVETCGYFEWIGPRIFDVWGRPKKRKLKTPDAQESERIFGIAEEIYEKLNDGK